jgi:hypothetical protein
MIDELVIMISSGRTAMVSFVERSRNDSRSDGGNEIER